jgi:hypothetical protein
MDNVQNCDSYILYIQTWNAGQMAFPFTQLVTGPCPEPAESCLHRVF